LQIIIIATVTDMQQREALIAITKIELYV